MFIALHVDMDQSGEKPPPYVPGHDVGPQGYPYVQTGGYPPPSGPQPATYPQQTGYPPQQQAYPPQQQAYPPPQMGYPTTQPYPGQSPVQQGYPSPVSPQAHLYPGQTYPPSQTVVVTSPAQPTIMTLHPPVRERPSGCLQAFLIFTLVWSVLCLFCFLVPGIIAIVLAGKFCEQNVLKQTLSYYCL